MCRSEQQIKTYLTRLKAKLKLTVARKKPADFAFSKKLAAQSHFMLIFRNLTFEELFLRTLLIRVLILGNPKEFYGWIKSGASRRPNGIFQFVVLISDSITFMIIAWVDEDFDRHYILMMLTSITTPV